MILNENMFTQSEQTDLGVTNLIINSINKKWESISDFNGVIATFSELGYDDMIPVIEDIVSNETNDIGKLQHLVEIISPTINQDIEAGETESSDILDDFDVPVEESLTESFDKDIYQWLDRNYGTTDWKIKFKAYVDKLEKSGYNTTTLKKDVAVAIKKFSKQVKVKPQVFQSALAEGLRNTDNIERNKKLVKHEDMSESLNEDVDENAGIYYVSYYEETPVYRPEEGGYYTASCELISSEEFTSLDDAKIRIAELAEADVMEKISDEFYVDRSKYIGQDRFYIIETEQGSETTYAGGYE